MKILSVCELSISSINPFVLRYKYDYASDWMSMKILGMETVTLNAPSVLRAHPKGVAKLKKQDLLSLCNSGLIKSEFVDFYHQLPEENTNNILQSIENRSVKHSNKKIKTK